jgi:hypothetical protein
MEVWKDICFPIYANICNGKIPDILISDEKMTKVKNFRNMSICFIFYQNSYKLRLYSSDEGGYQACLQVSNVRNKCHCWNTDRTGLIFSHVPRIKNPRERNSTWTTSKHQSNVMTEMKKLSENNFQQCFWAWQTRTRINVCARIVKTRKLCKWKHSLQMRWRYILSLRLRNLGG